MIKNKKDNTSGNLKIIPLGGVEEIGINCTVYEYENEIIVVDMGLGFSDYDYYGIDAIIPDIKYLKERKDKVKGIIITHGHLDHIGALQYHLESLNFPKIYGTKFTIELIKAKLEEKELLAKLTNKLIAIDDRSKLNLGKFRVEFFHVNHSIPQSVGVYIETPTAKAIHTGDFKFDNSPVNEPVTDYARIAELGKRKIDILLSDSTNSTKKGHPASESEVAQNMEDIIEYANGRIVVATFAGLVGRLYQLLNIAKRTGRKVAVIGYSMNQTLRIAREVGFIKIPDNLIVKPEEAEKLPAKRVMILTTGAQGETNAGLFKLANEGYRGLKLKKGDLVVLSARTIVGNDKAVQNLVDSITKLGAVVQQTDYVDFFTSGHGYQEDQKIMLNLVKPKYFMPVHGYQYFLRAHGETAKKVGIPENNIIIAQRGSIIEGNYKRFEKKEKIECEPLLVSGSGVGDVGETVLRERERLASFGVVIILLSLFEDKRLEKDPYVVTKGFVYVKSSQELIKEISNLAKEIYNKLTGKIELFEIRDQVNKEVSEFLFKETGREPITITIIS